MGRRELFVKAMKIAGCGAACFLALSALAATGVAPSKAELAAMYDTASRALEAGRYDEALQALDAIEARQPDLAETENLRGVALMRQGQYEKAEAILRKAREIEPKFLHSRFNLAEVAFLEKHWAEARDRFEALLAANRDELEEEMSRLIQYKILLTLVLENKETKAAESLSKFEGWKDSPALDYAKAAIALQHQKKAEAGGWMAAAEKQFSPELNKLFLESFYEIGWLQRPPDEPRPAIQFAFPGERAAQTKADAQANFEKAKRAFQQRDFNGALKFLDLCDAGAPNQAVSLTLRGEILMAQQKFDEAEGPLQKALAADPASWDAKFNLALVPFKKKDYAAARDRLEALLGETPGGARNQSAQLVQYRIFLALLLEGKESAAQKAMDQFKFTDDTPAFYYAQAAWGFQHNNPRQANEWVTSASKLFSPALNSAFADSFDDLGWLGAQSGPPAAVTESRASTETSPAPAGTENQPEITPTNAPTPAALAQATPETTRIVPAGETSPAVSPSPKKESLGRSRSKLLGEAAKKRRQRLAKSAVAKPQISPPLPSPSPSATPRPPFLKRLARTLLHPFGGVKGKHDRNGPDQTGSSEPASPSPTPPARNRPRN